MVVPEVESCGMPAEWRQALIASLEQGCAAGVQAGYPLTDLRVTVAEAPYQTGTTTEVGLLAAAQRGLAVAARQGRPTLLEPIMALELVVPTESAGKVLGSLQAEARSH
ncbi:MAG: hypothetical protein R2864_07150 [Syntrophotaleaceae bacterium]